MNDSEWLASIWPIPMLEFLQGLASSRKLRLFASSCCLHQPVWRLLNKEARALVDVAGRFADGRATWAEVLAAARGAPRGRVSGGSWRGPNPVRLSPSSQAERAALGLAAEDAWEGAWAVIREGANLLGSAPCGLLREIVGNPFRPLTPDPVWLSWQGGTVAKMAAAIYEGRRWYDMPVLGDALEEAGCSDQAVLEHCRGRGLHTRGCHVVDVLLGKE